MLTDGKTGTTEYAEIKRRFGWEFNGMRLHELYFENLNGTGTMMSGLAKKIESEFGSTEAWEKDFRAAGAMRGIGWIVHITIIRNRLFNSWINEHDSSFQVGTLLVMMCSNMPI
jgi:Fe-Mn family superoxide dismutase